MDDARPLDQTSADGAYAWAVDERDEITGPMARKREQSRVKQDD
jgi:hypothetical protein